MSDAPQQRRTPPSFDDMTSGRLFLISLLSSLFYLALAWILFVFIHQQTIASAFAHGFSLSAQLATGMTAGVLAAGSVVFISSRPPVSGVLDDFTIVKVVSRARFTSFDRLQLSIFAGVGEELLFRGAVQPLLGIWLTSFLFIAIHGYFKFSSRGHLIFGAMMFSLSLLLGLLFEYTGLVSAMSAHAIYDLLLLWWVRGRPGK